MNPAEAAPTPPSGRRSQGATATTSVYDIYEKCRIEEGTHTIRLLTLLPGTKNKPISCVLSSVSLDQAHSYTALSYVWGDTKDPQPNIWIDGSPLNITRNLHTALSYIRDAKTEKRIWVDAVCINQDNDREKRDQIWQMWNIYKNAKDVVAFVGDDKNSSDLVIDYLELQDVDRGSVSSEDLKESVNSLLNRPYWTRVWIIQELAANMNVRFQCGRKSVAFLALQNFFQRWQSENYIPCGGPFWAARDTLRLAAKLRNPEQDKHDIFGVMLAATRHESSLSVDKVYGLLGLFPHRLAGKLELNYRRKLEKVIEDLVTLHIKYDRNFNFLCDFPRYCDRSERHECPSWIPDIYNDLKALRKPYKAYGEKVYATEVILSDGVLSVPGEVIGSIVTTMGPFENRKCVLELTWAKERRLLKPGVSFCDMRKVVMQHCANRNTDGELDDIIFFELVAGDRWRDPNRHRCPYSCQELWDAVEDVEGHGSWESFSKVAAGFEFMFERLGNRMFLTTSNGLVGLGPAGLREGDLACVLYGCRLPVILREKSTPGHLAHFSIIGPAYIDGAMDGQYARGQGPKMFNIK